MPTKKYNPDEPGRQWPHRQMLQRLAGQDGCITWLLVELRALQKRVTKLEQRNDDLAAAALRLAHNSAEEFREPEPAQP